MKIISQIVDRIKFYKQLQEDEDVARLLKMSKTALSNHKSRKTIPFKQLFLFANNENLSLDWLLTGKGNMFIEPELMVTEPSPTYAIHSNCPADPDCKEVCKVCMGADPDDRKSIKQLTDILTSHDEGTKLAIKQNLDIFRGAYCRGFGETT